MSVADDIRNCWPELRPHNVQSQVWHSFWHTNTRFYAIVAGRRSGKTQLCLRKLAASLCLKKPWPDPKYVFLGPTYNQAKKVAWDELIRLIPKNWIPKKRGINIQEMSIRTVFGSILYVAGADKPQRIEGIGVDGVVVDESSDQKPGMYGKTIIPMLSERNGWCYRIGVPKRTGIGRVEFRDFWKKGLRGEDGVKSFHWESLGVLTEEQINEAKSQLTPEDFDEQFRAKWLDIGSNVYYNFKDQNINDIAKYDPTQEILVGCDFNVDPMCWTLSHFSDGKFYVFDEVFLKDTNTPRTLDHLYQKYYEHSRGWRFYGDASSRSRKTNAVKTDYLIIKEDARFGQKKVYFFKKNPHIRDRFASVNAGFGNAAGEIRIYINPDCKHLINDFNSVSYVEGTSDLEDYHGTDIGHMSDGFGYQVQRLMPIKLTYNVVPEVILTAAG